MKIWLSRLVSMAVLVALSGNLALAGSPYTSPAAQSEAARFTNKCEKFNFAYDPYWLAASPKDQCMAAVNDCLTREDASSIRACETSLDAYLAKLEAASNSNFRWLLNKAAPFIIGAAAVFLGGAADLGFLVAPKASGPIASNATVAEGLSAKHVERQVSGESSASASPPAGAVGI